MNCNAKVGTKSTKKGLSRRLYQKYRLPPRGYQKGATSFLYHQGIADKQNKEPGGVTSEQEKRMINGAIFGCEFAFARASAVDPVKSEKIMELSDRSGQPFEQSGSAL